MAKRPILPYDRIVVVEDGGRERSGPTKDRARPFKQRSVGVMELWSEGTAPLHLSSSPSFRLFQLLGSGSLGGSVPGERKLDGQAFASGFDLQRAVVTGDELPGVGDHPGDFFVVMVRVVMEEEEGLDLGAERERDDVVVQATVAPAHMADVFLPVVLR